jgi:hypothetical protein
MLIPTRKASHIGVGRGSFYPEEEERTFFALLIWNSKDDSPDCESGHWHTGVAV